MQFNQAVAWLGRHVMPLLATGATHRRIALWLESVIRARVDPVLRPSIRSSLRDSRNKLTMASPGPRLRCRHLLGLAHVLADEFSRSLSGSLHQALTFLPWKIRPQQLQCFT